LDRLDKRIRRNVYFIVALAALSFAVLFTAGTVFTLTVALAIDETSVGSVYLGNRPASDYPTYLERRISEWRADASYGLSFQGYVYDIDLGDLTFDVEETVSGIVRGVDNPAVFTIDVSSRDALTDELAAVFSDGVLDHFDADSFFSDLLSDVARLYRIRNYRLDDYLSAASAETVLTTVVVDGLDEADVASIVAAGGTYAIDPSARFSLLDATEESGLANEPLSILASAMQRSVEDVRFTSFLYRSWPTPPAWAEIGRNVRILRVVGLDFSFYNPMDFGYRFVVSAPTGTSLSVALVGYPSVETIDSEWDLTAVVPFATEIVEDDAIDGSTPGVIILDSDEATTYRVLVRAGTDGAIWFLNRTVTAPGGDPYVERVAIDERPAVAAIYRERVVPKGGE